MESRHGLAVAGMVTTANGTAEPRASEAMLKAKSKEAGRRITADEDKAYDTTDHVAMLRAANVTAHVAKNNSVTKTRKQHGTMRKTKHRGIASVTADFLLNLIAYNLIRIPKLIAA
jgi:hypothetical protein